MYDAQAAALEVVRPDGLAAEENDREEMRVIREQIAELAPWSAG
jgi:hypothetical protein